MTHECSQAKWMFYKNGCVSLKRIHERKIRSIHIDCVCVCECVYSQQTRTQTQVEREANNLTHTHSYKRAPVHNRRITLNAFNIFLYTSSSIFFFFSCVCHSVVLMAFVFLTCSLTRTLLLFVMLCLTKFEILAIFELSFSCIFILIYIHPLSDIYTQIQQDNVNIEWKLSDCYERLLKTLFFRNRSKISFCAYTIQLEICYVFFTNFNTQTFSNCQFYLWNFEDGMKTRKYKIKHQCVCLATNRSVYRPAQC